MFHSPQNISGVSQQSRVTASPKKIAQEFFLDDKLKVL